MCSKVSQKWFLVTLTFRSKFILTKVLSYNVEKDELTTQKDDSLYGIWWFTPELEIVDNEGEKIDSWDLDKQGFKPDFSQVDYSEVIANAKKSQE